MAAPTSENFGFGYQVNFNAGTFTLASADPVAQGTITVTDPNGGKVSLGQTITGSVHGVNPPSGTSLVFVAQANVQDHGNKIHGIVIEDTSDGNYYFLTDTKYTGN